jgi:hypothetical protein
MAYELVVALEVKSANAWRNFMCHDLSQNYHHRSVKPLISFYSFISIFLHSGP